MSAIAEQTKSTGVVEDEAPPPEFKMPPTHVGMVVAWLPGGRRERSYQVGIVVKISPSARALTLRMADGALKPTVRHVDDPKLDFIEDAREQGAWDYTDEHKAQEARYASLRADLDSVREQLKQVMELFETPSKTSRSK